jgi:hypothetical protein
MCKNIKKNLDSYYFFTIFNILFLKNDVNVRVSDSDPYPGPDQHGSALI